MTDNAKGARRPLGRLVAPLFLFGVVGVVLVAHGFWKAEDLPPVLNALPGVSVEAPLDDPAQAAPTPEGDTIPIVVSIPGESTTSVLHDSVASPAFAGYVHRPAASVTLPSQRITVTPARRDDTAAMIATRTGVGATAVMYANGITDPDQPIPVGQSLRIPPPGTMLHRIKESDTLDTIAKAYRIDADAITKYPGNTVQQSGDLVPGDFLIIPTLNLPMRDKVIFYQIHDGDSLSKITSLYNLSDPQTLKWANNLPSVNFVLPGQIIAVPPVDGVIHVVEPIDTQRTIDDAITQIAKNFACTSVPCTDTPSDERVNALVAAIFAFGPNHLTHGGKLIQGQEIVIPNGKPYVEPPPVVIPQTVVIDNPDTTTAATSGSTTSVTTRRTTTTTMPAPTARSGGTTRTTPTTTTTTITTGANYGGGSITSVAARYVGQTRQPSGLPWAFWCEKFVGDVADQAGVGHYRYGTALADAAAGKLYGGHAPAGSLVFFDQSWNVAGHVGIAMGDGTMISALSNGVVRTAYEGSSGYLGWRPFP